MIRLLEDECQLPADKDEKDIRKNVVNNIRRLYIELHDNGKVINVKDFASQCCSPQSTAESWLRRNVIPKPEKRALIERIFGLPLGSLTRERHPTIQNWHEEYYKRNGAKPSLRTYKMEEMETLAVAEEETEYDKSAKTNLTTLCNELLQYQCVWKGNKTIQKIMIIWLKRK